jgi:NTP pyrophosphatase (non-canonical NTP hydrolase)
MQFDDCYVNEANCYYDEFVARLVKPLPKKEHLNHMALGVAGEAGELVDCIKKHTIYEKPLDRENLVEELGDLMFYMQGIMNKFALGVDEVIAANARKLMKRYETLQYSNEAAIARADKLQEGDSNGQNPS